MKSIMTIGMRGDGDMPMMEGADMAANVDLLERIVADQRRRVKHGRHYCGHAKVRDTKKRLRSSRAAPEVTPALRRYTSLRQVDPTLKRRVSEFPQTLGPLSRTNTGLTRT